MGRNGQIAIQQKYNWGNEAKTLLALYETLLADKVFRIAPTRSEREQTID
jgi:hypothetical protein